jgi:hypothetical protein
MRVARSWFAFGGALVAVGCDLLAPGPCSLEARAGIEVEIRDARTGAPIAADARGAVRDGAYLDSLGPGRLAQPPATGMISRMAAHERAGTYAVEVLHDGYQPWTADGIRVRRGRCHVATVLLRADLSAASP